MTLETVATEQPQPSPSPQALQLPGIAADIDERSDLSDGSIDVSVEEYFKALPPPNPSGMNPAKKRAKSVSSDGSSVAISPEPVVISTSITTQNIRELTELLQTSTYSRFCISTVFDIEPPTSTGGCPAFTAILRFMRNNTVVHEERTPDCYPNKKMAKEVVAGIGIAALPSLIQGMTEDAPLPEEKLDEEDWVSILHMFCQARHVLPQYTHFSPQPQRRVEFSCEVVLPNELGLAGTDDRIFGDKHQYFRNKKIAKCAAAKEAVIWIRDQPEAFLKDNLTRNTPSKNLASPNKGLVPKGGEIVLRQTCTEVSLDREGNH
jgi:hypothetical protein